MSDRIKRIYIGLPKGVINKILWVERKFRTNALSHQPGGYDVVIEFHSENVFGYDWIKSPSRYIDTVLSHEAVNIGQENYAALDSSEQITIAKELINKMYARSYANKEEYAINSFQEVWNSFDAILSPKEALEQLETNYSKNVIKVNELYDEASALCGSDCGACFTILDEIIKINPNFRLAYVKKIRCIKRDDEQNIVDECKDLLLKFPNDDEVMGIAAQSLFTLKKYNECYKFCQEALNANEFNPNGLFYKARIFSMISKSEKNPNPVAIAIKYYRKYVQSIDENPKSDFRAGYNNLGDLYKKEGKNALAAVCYHKALRIIEETIKNDGITKSRQGLLKTQQRKVEEIDKILGL